jgi:hypothetical protein
VTEDTQIARFLAGMDVPLTQFASINHESVPVKRIDGHIVPYVPPGTTSTSPYWKYILLAGTLVWTLLTLMVVTVGAVDLPSAVDLGILVIWALFPVATYFDVSYVRANSTWDPNWGRWVVANAIPYLNAATGAYYVYKRHGAIFFDAE